VIADEFDLVVIGGGIVGTAIADAATARGLHVALIEIGPAELSEQQPATPAVVCRRRLHLGCVAARNHVLGGNGHYWGGGLIRPPSLLLGDILGADHDHTAGPATEDLGPYFATIEQRLGLPKPQPRVSANLAGDYGERLLEAEICILPGRMRNLAADRLAGLRASSLFTLLTKVLLVGFESEHAPRGRNIRALWIEREGARTRILGRQFVVAAGVVDSNLIVQRFAAELLTGIDTSQLGRYLHDHWSVPIAEVDLKAAGNLRKILAYRFHDGLIVGRRYELPKAKGWGARGFLHFTFGFDEASPYREIKHLMMLRQQHAGPAKLIANAIRLLHQLPSIARIGLERVFAKRLFIADSVRVVATLDFEGFPHANNYLRLDGDHASFDWDISEEDELSFLSLLATCRRTLAGIEKRFSVSATALFDWGNDAPALEYFRHAATDAYHLGGGLAAGSDAAVLDFNLRLRGTSNLYVVSTAAFRRPGIVNPTHCLLALAERFTEQLSKGY
jgi:choline dehydrogenase-like flavoprotein